MPQHSLQPYLQQHKTQTQENVHWQRLKLKMQYMDKMDHEELYAEQNKYDATGMDLEESSHLTSQPVGER